ncbi:MAG: cyclic pyranopterin monophosphate synthase MoaC [Halobacteriovorax sp.]|nr:cyclic pyranopterin monophosphate synthase MoaC [Halobacteriovorax sp.]|tara:strand:- start:26627 stop:27097 length:471 start_codon:yes stop_codon:yes gene_type:complete
MKEFSHIDKNNNPCMVDVSKKNETTRFAHARTEVWLPKVIRDQFIDGDIQSKKGPVFHTAIIAGTMGLKQTSNLIPFCHQLNIEGSSVEIKLEGESAVIDCTVKNTGKTGVEMEALMGAQIAALTIYDMCKAFGHEMQIRNGKLIEKRGGKSDYKN